MKELEKLYKQTRSRHVRNVARILNGDYAAAEDVFQQAFLNAITYYSTYDPKKARVENWFARILYNEMSRYMRKEKARHAEDIDRFLWIEDEIDYNKLIENYCVIKKLIEGVGVERDKKILALVYLKGYSHPEAASICDVTDTNVRQICFRFRENIEV